MKLFSLIALIFFSVSCFAQSGNIDSCNILPYHKATFAGVDAMGMISFDDRNKLKKLISDDKDAVIIRFVVVIDCDECDIYTREIYGDSLSAQDIKTVSKSDAHYVMRFECITGKTKQGDLISHKPFLFYIKP